MRETKIISMGQATLDQDEEIHIPLLAVWQQRHQDSRSSHYCTRTVIFRSMCDAMNKNWETIFVFFSHQNCTVRNILCGSICYSSTINCIRSSSGSS